MVICGSYIVEFSVSKGMKKTTMIKGEFTQRKVVERKITTHLCLTLIVKE